MISTVELVLWPLLGGIGLLLLLTAQPIGRPRPSLATRLAALRPDTPLREPEQTAFTNPTLERLLVPPLRAAGALGLRLAELLGIPTHRLARRLRLAGEPGGPALHVGQKVFGALLGLALLPVLNQLHITLFGRWPAWLWLAAGAAGFLTPDAELARKTARRRRELLVGLGAASEFLGRSAAPAQISVPAARVGPSSGWPVALATVGARASQPAAPIRACERAIIAGTPTTRGRRARGRQPSAYDPPAALLTVPSAVGSPWKTSLSGVRGRRRRRHGRRRRRPVGRGQLLVG
jgi:hypothetical protein